MDITLIAHTTMVPVHPEGPPYVSDQWLPRESDDDSYWANDADWLAEFAGRSCYQSWHRPNPKTASNDDYLAHILESAHESVLEHASATFYVTGVSRSLTHELIRHRHLSYSELSQRFVDIAPSKENKAKMSWVVPSGLNVTDDHDVIRPITAVLNTYVTPLYQSVVDTLMKRGKTRKEARQAARAVMPNMMETRIVVTGNMRAWRDVIKKRYHVAADAEIREFAKIVLDELRSIAPNTFQDMPHEPFGSMEKGKG
jgi:thymidylate synthase (FAD)